MGASNGQTVATFKARSRTVPCTALAPMSGKTAVSTKANTSLTRSTDKGSTLIQTGQSIEASGLMACSTAWAIS